MNAPYRPNGYLGLDRLPIAVMTKARHVVRFIGRAAGNARQALAPPAQSPDHGGTAVTPRMGKGARNHAAFAGTMANRRTRAARSSGGASFLAGSCIAARRLYAANQSSRRRSWRWRGALRREHGRRVAGQALHADRAPSAGRGRVAPGPARARLEYPPIHPRTRFAVDWSRERVSQQGCTQHGYSVPFRVVELTVMSASAIHWGQALGPPWDTTGYATPALTTRPEMGVLSQGH